MLKVKMSGSVLFPDLVERVSSVGKDACETVSYYLPRTIC